MLITLLSHSRYYTCWLETTAPPPEVQVQAHVDSHDNANPTANSSAMTSSVSSLTEASSVNNSNVNSPSTSSPSPFLGFDGFKFQPDDIDFLSIRGGQQSRSLSFPRIHFGDDDEDEEDSDDDTSPSASESDGTRSGATEDSTEEERSRSKVEAARRRKSSDGRGRLLRKAVGREVEDSGDLENSGLSAAGWGSRVLYIQMVGSSSRLRFVILGADHPHRLQEYVENQTLKEAIGRGLSEDESWRLFRQILEALVHMASLGIVHRDLKPSNLLVGQLLPLALLYNFSLTLDIPISLCCSDHEVRLLVGRV